MVALLKTTQIQEPSSSTVNLALDTSGGVTVGQNLSVSGTATFGTNVTSSGTVVMSSPYTMRNLIINGAMQVWQRGTSFTDPTALGNFYTADRWGANRSGDATGITVSRSTSAPTGFQYSLVMQRTAGNAGTAAFSLWNSNETVNCIQYQGQNITLSFYAKAGANYSGGALSVSVNTGTGTDQRVYAYTGSSTIISSSQSITTTWTRYTFTGTVSSSATEIGLSITWTPTGTAGADDAVYFTGLQLERGTVATPFEYRNAQQELAMCQRYFITTRFGNQNGNVYITDVAINTSRIAAGFQFPVVMRTDPTVTIYSCTADTAGAVTTYNSTGVAIGSTFAANNGSAQGIFTYIGGSASLTAGSFYSYAYTASAEL